MNNHRAYIHRCSCYCHFLCIDYDLKDKTGYFSMYIDTPTLWGRIKHVVKYLWKGGTKFEYWHEILFEEKDIEKFENFFISLKKEKKDE